MKETTDLLHQLIEKYNRNQLDDTEYAKVNGMFLEVDDRTTLARRMRACANRITPESFLEQTGIPLIHDLIQEIEDAFCTGSAVLTAFGVLDPHNLPDSIEELSKYGQESIDKLVEFYGIPKDDEFQGHRIQVRAQFNEVNMRTELETFKRHLFMLSPFVFFPEFCCCVIRQIAEITNSMLKEKRLQLSTWCIQRIL